MGKGLVESFISESVPCAPALGLAYCCDWSPKDFNYSCAAALLGGQALTDGTQEWTTWPLKACCNDPMGCRTARLWGLPDSITHLTLTFA